MVTLSHTKAAVRKRSREGKVPASCASGTPVKSAAGFEAVIINRKSVHLVLIAFAGLLVYSNTFSAPFIWDDLAPSLGIARNPVITNIDNFLVSSYGYGYNPRRFIGYFSFALNYWMGGLNVAGYHVVNILIHILNGLLVYVLVVLAYRSLTQREPEAATPRYSSLVAFFSALAFVVHPIQTQAVTYTYQRFTSLATTFYLLSVVLYIKGRMAQSRTKAWRTLILAVLSAVLAMRTKEIAFTLPLVIVLYEYLFFKGASRKRILFAGLILATLLIIPLGLLHMNKPFGEVIRDVDAASRVQVEGAESRRIYLATELRVITTYLRLLVFPVNQNLDYDYPIYRSFLEPAVFLSSLLLLSLVGAAVYLIGKSGGGDRVQASSATVRIAGFGILWFFITLSVESSIIPIADVIFEHRVYLPSVGILIAITALAVAALDRFDMKPMTMVSVFGCVVGILMITAFMRNQVYGSAVSIWSDTSAKSPGLSRPLFNLGNAYAESGDFERAIGAYRQSLSLPQKANSVSRERAQVCNNLGCAYGSLGKYDEAIEVFNYVLKNIDPDFLDSSLNLGAALINSQRYREAISVLQQVLVKNADCAAAHYSLALAYHGLADEDNAAREIAIARNLPQNRAMESGPRTLR